MKSVWSILLLSLLSACTQKYVDYDVIRKLDFMQNPEQRPVAPAMLKGQTDELKQCFNQWFFTSNADSERNRYLPQAVQMICPGAEWLLDTRITQSWWTTLVFSRACVEIKGHCPVIPQKR